MLKQGPFNPGKNSSSLAKRGKGRFIKSPWIPLCERGKRRADNNDSSFSNKPQKKWMELALRSASQGIKKSEGGPFGAVIVRGGRAIAVAHNTVLKNKDATCHAEVNAIRIASQKLKRFDLSDCVIYSTTEPCPMCFSAIHWARIARVVFGTSIADVAKRGFNELSISGKKMKREGKSPVSLRVGFMRKECLELLKAWDRNVDKRTY
jgi:tRNA(Arg) A34 adenosine deaminase TadA